MQVVRSCAASSADLGCTARRSIPPCSALQHEKPASSLRNLGGSLGTLSYALGSPWDSNAGDRHRTSAVHPPDTS